MGLEIPGELADLLNELGYTWPKSDETQMMRLGQWWIEFAGTLAEVGADADAAVRTASVGNRGDDIDAFRTAWGGDRAGRQVLADGVAGAQSIGACLIVCAGVVLTLKINVIVQLTILAVEILQAVLTAPETFGASLLEIPVFKKLTDMAINFLISQALEVVLG
ncbi:hypothetical protein [Actinoplanes teichomyceticus]|uniref:Outer membrane channel protein CpnT-like N-terminal domain-containing protein n=1 Tax=Actinoplanes teichomyceticus TaxID=1867 RepID=A0A561VKV5_ACTTI|nr:hypothetical protein [Actinoplanes teichomyceticus]TWG12253.1 hypothetical protein FHX34_105120 [Actinoplanes teichomyceticus]GIF14190.1 hypothetical protein Ate01nite_42220 [Actinoplanes teichomyceticus]